ncbi:hypothetical protein [Sphingomonas bacterium]|uniref:hypothetical protein n=1 Tax=Sphingomonas bacterium TaxID=1895847 RepID=UPI00261870DE|nr:hypothetical protein [Sphingomonas bacterium]MDB5677360.1 hypothetical protein [Sphingomonas bacterium]
MSKDDMIAWGMDLVVVLLAIGMIWTTAKGLRTGVARGRYGRTANRDTNPAAFRRTIWMTGFSAVVLVLFAIALTVRMIVRGAA